MSKFKTAREILILSALLVGTSSSSMMATAAPAAPVESTFIKNVRSDLKRYGPESSFCYVEEKGAIQGVNANQPVKIASVMKLLTTLWAVDKFGPNHEYVTKIYYQPVNGEMHIQGTRDPFFDRDRLYLLLSDLNRNKIKKLNRLTFDGNFLINMDLFEFAYDPARNMQYMYTEAHSDAPLGGIGVKEKLEVGFNTATWWSGKKGRYLQARKRNPTSNMVEALSFQTTTVDKVPSNPLAGKPGVLTFEIRSLPIKNYLKKMNIHSLNASADELFYSMGGAPAFRTHIQQKYGMGADAVDIQTGSGLPLHDPRNDSTMSCSATVRLIRALDSNLEARGMDLTDVMMIAGTDAGATYNDGSRALVVKTGTLNSVKNVAGVANTTSGEVYFGIFLQRGGNVQGVRNIVGRMKAKYRMQAINKSSFVWDPLDPKMALRMTNVDLHGAQARR